MTSFLLKLIALLTMTVDHVGYALCHNNLTMRFFGRIAFPIYAFLLVQGFMHTKDDPQRIKKYLFRTGIFAIISEIPFDLCFQHKILEFTYQNVFFTLFISLLSLYCTELVNKKGKDGFFVMFPFALLLYLSKSDYAVAGIVLIYGLYYIEKIKLPDHKTLKTVATVILLIFMSALEIGLQADFDLQTLPFVFRRYAWVYLGVLMSAIPITTYSGKLGMRSKALQMFFYAYYPLHLSAIYLLTQVIH